VTAAGYGLTGAADDERRDVVGAEAGERDVRRGGDRHRRQRAGRRPGAGADDVGGVRARRLFSAGWN